MLQQFNIAPYKVPYSMLLLPFFSWPENASSFFSNCFSIISNSAGVRPIEVVVHPCKSSAIRK